MKRTQNSGLRKRTRQGISFLLAMILMLSAFAPGAAYATEGAADPTPEGCTVCGAPECGENHVWCESHQSWDCKETHEPAPLSLEEGCTVCGAPECGENHVWCESHQSWDCKETHESAPLNLEEVCTVCNADPCVCPPVCETCEGAHKTEECSKCAVCGQEKADCTCPPVCETCGAEHKTEDCPKCGICGLEKKDCICAPTCDNCLGVHKTEDCPLCDVCNADPCVCPPVCEICEGAHKTEECTKCAECKNEKTECSCPKACETCGHVECICSLPSIYLLNGAKLYKDYTDAAEEPKVIDKWNIAVKIVGDVITDENGVKWHTFKYNNLLKELFNDYKYVRVEDTTAIQCTCTPVEGVHQGQCEFLPAYDRAMATLTAFEEEAKTLADGLDKEAEDYVQKLTEKCNAFFDKLYECVLSIDDMFYADVPTITEEQYNAAVAKFTEIEEYLKNTYGSLTTEPVTYDLGAPLPITGKEGININLFDYGSKVNQQGDWTFVFNGSEKNLGYDDWYLDENTINSSISDPLAKIFAKNKLKDGYPELNYDGTDKSLKYLFDKSLPATTVRPYDASVLDGEGDTNYAVNRYAVEDGSLFAKSDEGYYYYDSRNNHAYYQDGKFWVMDYAVTPGITNLDKRYTRMGHFLPFNGPLDETDAEGNPRYIAGENYIQIAEDGIYDESVAPPCSRDDAFHKTTADLYQLNTYGADDLAKRMNMWFGMSVDFDFFQPADGKIQNKDMIYEFSGDDFMWVYVDGVLILDIFFPDEGTKTTASGMASAGINFATGEVIICNTDEEIAPLWNMTKEQRQSKVRVDTTLKALFEQAGKDTSDFTGDTFTNYTKHSFDMFYMEYGTNTSNCYTRFNIEPLPENSVSVSKAVKNDTNPNAKAFQFQVKLQDADGNPVTDAPAGGKNVNWTTDDNWGIGTFSLKNNEMVTFSLNAGVKYKVTELSANSNNYVTTVSGAEIGSLTGLPVMVAYTNTLQTGGIERDKYVTEGDNLGDYTIHLEAFATGEIAFQESAKPTDIVVAFDHSGSMLRALNTDEWTGPDSGGAKITSLDDLDPVKGSVPGYYVASGNTQTVFLLYKDGQWYYSGVDDNMDLPENREGYLATDFNSHYSKDYFTGNYIRAADDYLDTFVTNGIYKTRFGAAYDALLEFVDKVEATGVDHRIALVTYAGNEEGLGQAGTGMFTKDEKFKVYYTTGLSDSENDLYSQALMSIKDEKSTIQNCIGQLYSGHGYTRTDLGIEMANNIFDKSDDGEERDHLLVVLSDGVPSSSQIENIVDKTIGEAEKAKTEHNAKVFSIGALATTDTTAIDTMDKISSNYLNGTKRYDQYYYNATHTDQMSNIFDIIVTDISGTQVTLDEYSILRDTISEYFKLDPDAAKSIKVYTAECTGQDTNGFTWAEPVLWTEGHLTVNGASHCDTGCQQPLEVTVTGQQIDVKGFDYSLNYVAANGANSGRGRKLIVEIPVTMSDSNFGGTHQKTNDEDNTGIYDDGDRVVDFPLPHVDTPAKVTIEKNVTGNMGDWAKNFTFTVNGTRYRDDESEEERPKADSYNNMENDGILGNSNYLYAQGETLNETFTLTHSGKKTFDNIVAGIAYKDENGKRVYTDAVPTYITIEEKDFAPYDVTVAMVRLDEDGKEVKDANGKRILDPLSFVKDDDGKEIEGKLMIPVTPGMTIVFTNDKDALIDTGVVLDSLPYILILGGVAVAVVFLILRRRNRYDD